MLVVYEHSFELYHDTFAYPIESEFVEAGSAVAMVGRHAVLAG
jgi:hypothetical protein